MVIRTAVHAPTDLSSRVDELRRAQAQLARRLSAHRAPNDTDREAMRFIAGCSEGAPATPGALAEHLRISTAAVTSVLRRLQERGQVVVAPHPTDARSKLLRPSLRDLHSPVDDLVTRVDALASEFSAQEKVVISRFLGRLVEEISETL